MENSITPSGFKIIAIVPLKNCNQKFRKNLKIGVPYLFYNNYKIKLSENKYDIESVSKVKSAYAEELYNLKNGIKINISAVVGANGSGKSALIELFYYFVYALSSLKKLPEIELSNYSKIVEYELNILDQDIELLKENQENHKIGISIQYKYDIQIDLNNTRSNYNFLLNQALKDKKEFTANILKEAKEVDQLLENKFNVALIYEIDNKIHIIEYKKGKVFIKNADGSKDDNHFSFTELFYSISLNYSHHSLNSKVLGGWINSLFHKNDGYRTPVVINPMRTDGMYDINHELNLSKERLMFNLAYYLIENQYRKADYKLLYKYKIEEITLSIKPSVYSYPIGFTEESLKDLSSYFLLKNFINGDNAVKIVHLDICIGYLEKKLEKIKKNYNAIIFKDFEDTEEKKDLYFQDFVLNDNSHITKKVKQVVNYLRYAVENIGVTIVTKPIFRLKTFESTSLTSDEFITYIQENRKINNKEENISLNVLDLMSYLPPSIFNIDFRLSLKNKKKIFLSQLSSGEQQMIFNINTILYHLYNLQSTFLSNNTRIVYKNISIFLDEIELYYHPNMQREILKEILDSLELIKDKGSAGIESINICFLTHSPFILSDIPSQNVLKLKEGEPKENDKINSFAANIYDLLKDEFYLKDGAIGAFANKKISEVLSKKLIEQQDLDIINLIGDPFLKGVIQKKIEKKLSSTLLKKEIKRLKNILNNHS